MEAIIKHGENERRLDINPSDIDMTVADLRNEYAARFGFFEERFRFCYLNGDLLHESQKVLDLPKWEPLKVPGPPSEADSSDKDADQLQDEKGSGKRKPAEGDNSDEERPKEERSLEPKEQPEGDKGPEGVEEKGQLDSSEEEKSDIRRRAELILQMIDTCLNGKDKEREISFDQNFVRNEIITVMRMSREETKLPMTGDRVPRAQVLYLEVEEGFPVFMVTDNDGVKHLSCLGGDTIGTTRGRFASVFECSRENLVIMKEGTQDVYEIDDDGETLETLGIDEGSAFHAHMKGSKEVLTIFGFSLCVKVKVNMNKPIRSVKKEIVRLAPDLKRVHFYLWYNGMRLPEEDRTVKNVDAMPMGKRIMGCHFLRVMLDLDPDLPVSVDDGPDMRAKRPAADQPMVIKKRKKNPEDPPMPKDFVASGDEEKKKKKEEEEKVTSGEEKTSEDDSEKDEKKKRNPGDSMGSAKGKKKEDKKRIRLELNKRAQRYFTILVECDKVEDLIEQNTNGNGAEHEAPITLDDLLPTMRLHELRERIASYNDDKDEKWQHQIIFRNGEPLSSNDDHKTLRQLELHKTNGLYKEPSIKIKINVDEDKTVDMKLSGRSTTFTRLAELLEEMNVCSLTRSQMFFNVKKDPKHPGVFAVPDATFSDYSINSGDELQLIRPFRVRVWHRCFAYDANMFAHSSSEDLKAWLKKESEIEPDMQVLTKVSGQIIEFKKGRSLGESKITKDSELELYASDDLPQRLRNPTSGQWVDSDNGNAVNAQYSQFVESRHDEDEDDEDDDENDEDDENYNPEQ